MGSSLVVLLALSIALAYAQDPGDVDFSQDVDFQEPYYAVVSDSQSDQTANIEFSGKAFMRFTSGSCLYL
ncbi:hypothetical protein BV898_07806 [Hypsibius exemplaris]|uniref:Uncharacterized protein n=1 Tax=Hypsibius exemplaris TaxID=2072580 RepID=A0A1W0WSR5_HYPEX|nr:hypothetical protein BV898_07806 [Hypsibius exemplaris]